MSFHNSCLQINFHLATAFRPSFKLTRIPPQSRNLRPTLIEQPQIGFRVFISKFKNLKFQGSIPDRRLYRTAIPDLAPVLVRPGKKTLPGDGPVRHRFDPVTVRSCWSRLNFRRWRSGPEQARPCDGPISSGLYRTLSRALLIPANTSAPKKCNTN